MPNYKDNSRLSKKTVMLVIAVSFILITIISLFSFLAVMASTDNIYSGISIGKVDLDGMNKSEAIRALAKAYDIDDINVKVNCEGTIFDIYGSSFGLKPDFEASADKALSYGKDSNIFEKMLNVIKLKGKRQYIDLVVSCDYNILQYAINEKLYDKITDVLEYSVEIGEGEIIVTNGRSGKMVSAQKLINLISKAITNGTLLETINVGIEVVEPEVLDIDKFIKEYNREAKDASVKQDGEEITIIPEVIGVKINDDEAREILQKNKNSSESYSIPAIITYPEITKTQLEAEYINTVIASYSTDYSTSTQNRKTNIAIAAAKINGVTLNPGEVFSFNGVVGPRTQSTGYKMAHVYSGSKVVDGIGGGICQVSSTLYNAVVLADMEIVYRTNHSMPVSYVPLGRDATVSYGTIDFKFKNNKETPVKFEVIADGATLTINVYGRKKYIKDISIESHIVGSVPFSTDVIEDDTMFEDESIVVEDGVNGTKVEAYKIIKENGVVVSRTLLAKSNYRPTTKVVKVGTLKRETTGETSETVPNESEQTKLPDSTEDASAVPSDALPQEKPIIQYTNTENPQDISQSE